VVPSDSPLGIPLILVLSPPVTQIPVYVFLAIATYLQIDHAALSPLAALLTHTIAAAAGFCTGYLVSYLGKGKGGKAKR